MKKTISFMGVSLAVVIGWSGMIASAFAAAETGTQITLPVLTSQSLAFDASTREVEVTYTLAGAPAVVTAEFCTNGAAIAENVVQTLSGDINVIVQPGEHGFLWNPDRDLPLTFDASTQLTVKLTVWPLDHTPDYVAVDLTVANHWFFYTSSNAVPGGVQNVRYKTDMLLMRRIPACNQRFRMGSPVGELGGQSNEMGTILPEVRHWVTLTKDFYLGIYEVTQAQYRHMNRGYITGKWTDLEDSDIMPVNSLRYVDMRSGDWPQNPTEVGANTVLGSLRATTGLNTFDFPTDAQWEFACRAGTDTGLYNGTQLNYSSANRWSVAPGVCPNLDVVAWWSSNAEMVTNSTTGATGSIPHPVGQKPCNAFGLYDMLGNVHEYCRDWYANGSNYSDGSEVTDPVGAASGTYRVVRGGSLGVGAYACRCASRGGRSPTVDWSDVNCYQDGMRVSCEADFRVNTGN